MTMFSNNNQSSSNPFTKTDPNSFTKKSDAAPVQEQEKKKEANQEQKKPNLIMTNA